MATKQLLVELDAKFDDLIKNQDKVNKQLQKMHEKSKKADSSMLKLKKSAKSVGGALGKMGSFAKSSAVALAGSRAAMVAAGVAAAQMGKDIKNSAELANLSVEEMQAMAFATNTVGINMEKLGDISKDTSEKIGDFLNTGGGGFQDFADAMQFTEAQAKDMAESFKGMAGVDILQSMVTQMEEAGVSAEQMSHALEGMASDTTALIPLMKEGGKAVDELKQNFLDTSVVLNDADIESLGDMSRGFSQLGNNFKGVVGKFSVEYAEQINSMIDSTNKGLKVIGDEFASGSFTDRMNSFYNAFASSWAVAMNDNADVSEDFQGDFGEIVKVITKAWLDFVLTLPITLKKGTVKVRQFFFEIIDDIKIKMAEANLLMQEGLDAFGQGNVAAAQLALDAAKKVADNRVADHEKEMAQLEAEKQAIIAKFDAEQAAATAKREQYAADAKERMSIADEEHEANQSRVSGVEGGAFNTGGGTGEGEGDGAGLTNPEDDPRYLNELALFELMLQMETDRLSSFEEIKKEELRLHQEALDKKLISEEEYHKRVTNSTKKAMKSQADAEKRGKEGMLKNLMVVNEHMLNDNKAVNAALIVASTAQNVVESVKNSGGVPWGLPAGAAAAAMGIAQLANLKSASKGGGSISTGASGVVASGPQREPDFAPETTGVEVSERDASGAQQTVVVKIETDSDDPLINTIAEQLDRNQRQGG